MGKRRLIRLPFGLIGAGLISVVVTTMLVWMGVVDDPFGGEPVAVIPLDETVRGVSSRDIEVVEINPVTGGDLGPDLNPEAAGNLLGPRYELIERPSGIDRMSPEGPLSFHPDNRVIERADVGMLPKVSDAGVRPLDAYARPVAVKFESIPRIAIIINGLGLSSIGTQNAIDRLPPDVTLALAPYGEDLDGWMQQARRKGNELLLQVPLEPFDFPDNDPGPHTLLVSLKSGEMLERLNWVLSRATNYVGTIADMGSRFTSTAPSMEFLLNKLKDRGLVFVDSGTSSRSVAGEVADGLKMPFSGVDVVLDETPREEDIDAKLLQLESIARSRGVAVASGSALPVTVRQLEKWVQGLEQRGLQLVPVSATIDRPVLY